MCKYASCCQTIKRLQKSGTAPSDFIVDSLALYKSDTGSEFKDMTCYKLLNNAPKWQDNPIFLEMCTPLKFDHDPEIYEQTPKFLTGSSDGPAELASLPAMDRPMGNKQARRAKFTPTDSVAPQILANSNSVASSAARLVEEQSLQRITLQRMLEHSILMSNTNGLDEKSKADIEAEKAKIIARNTSRCEKE